MSDPHQFRRESPLENNHERRYVERRRRGAWLFWLVAFVLFVLALWWIARV